MANIKALYGKYLVTLEYPKTFQELVWRVSYMRRNRESWRLLTNSFKPSTTNYTTDVAIKNATLAAIDAIEYFYESAATIDPYNPKLSAAEKFLFRLKRAAKPSMSSAGIDTDLSNATLKQYTRIQAANPVSVPNATNDKNSSAAENIPQDIEKIREGITAILNSYGSPYVTERGADCTQWVFNSRNTAFKAVSLITQEYPWIMQIIKSFPFFTADVVNSIKNKSNANPAGLAPTGQLYGHLESALNENVDSPRHLLTPLWSETANIESTNLTALNTSGSTGKFQIQFTNTSGTPSNAQNLLAIYCNDTYEQNAFFTNSLA